MNKRKKRVTCVDGCERSRSGKRKGQGRVVSEWFNKSCMCVINSASYFSISIFLISFLYI